MNSPTAAWLSLVAGLALLLMLPGCPAGDDDDGDDDTGDDDTGDDDAGDDDGADDDAGDDDSWYEDPPAPTEWIGRIQVIEVMQDDTVAASRVEAWFWAGAVPSSQQVVEESGDCKLLVGALTNPWGCDPPCDVGEICINEVCEPYPATGPTGTLTIDGLPEAVVLEPDGTGRYPAIYDLPASLTGPGDAVHVFSTGDVTPALDLTALGVPDLQCDEWSFQIEHGKDMELSWEPGPGGDRIQVILATGWHAAADLTTIWCETDDDGELVIPQSMVDQFDIPSCGECEGSLISRFRRDAVDFGDGPIELFVASQRIWVPWWDWN
jgi:hypothetical protein